MNSNRAQYSANFSYTNAKARGTSGDLPDEYTSDAPSDKCAEFGPSNPLQGLRQPRRAAGSRSRPVSRAAADSVTGKTSAGSESRLRYSVNSADDLNNSEDNASRRRHQLHSSSASDEDRFPSSGARQGETGEPRASGESAEGLSYGQESARRLSKENQPAGGVSAVDGGTVF